MQGVVTKYEEVISVLRKPPDSRNEFEVNALIPWFRKRSKLFESLKTDIVFDVIKNLSFLACDADEILIKEGDLGDCMYIILRGTVGIYRLPEDPKSSAGGGGGTEEQPSTGDTPSDSGTSKGELIRRQLGERVTTIGENSTFGDVALMSEDCIRTASVLTEEPSDLIVFDRDLYNRSVKSVLKKEFDDKTNFIANSRYFRYWQNKYRKQLAMAMTKMTMPYEATVTRQGQTVDAIYFLLSGEVKVVMDPKLHRIQYRKMMSILDEIRDHGQNNDSQDGDEQRKTKILRGQDKESSTSREPSKKSKRLNGQTSNKPRRSQLSVEVCLLGVNECVGDIEVMMELRTYLQTAICTQKTEVLQVELRHFERLFLRRHPRTVDMMKEDLTVRLGCRMSSSRLTSAVSILACLIKKAEGFVQLKRRQTAARRAAVAVAVEPNQARRNRTISEFYEKFVPIQGALIDLYGPGTVFHRIRQREQIRVTRLKAAGGHRLRRVLESGANIARTKHRIRRGYNWTAKFDVNRTPTIIEAKHARVEFGEESKNDGGCGDARQSDETIDPVLKNLEDRMHNWLRHRADKPDFRRQPPGVSRLNRTQTENLVFPAAGSATQMLQTTGLNNGGQHHLERKSTKVDFITKDNSNSAFPLLPKSAKHRIDIGHFPRMALHNGSSTTNGYW